MKLLLRLYPQWWRRRYGAEALDILQSRPVRAAALWDLVVGAIDAWLKQEIPPSGARGYNREAGHLMASRWPFYASVAVLGCACVACLFAGSIEWGERGAMVGIDSAEAAEQARFAIELYAIGALNMLASIAFLLRRSGWVWWLVLGVQMGVFVLALIEGVLTDLGWFFFSSLPLLTLLLLFAFRNAQARLKSPVERNLTPT